ncbi:thioredoxin domain-containing protein 15 isoform X2 [Periplaneta americana]|uniref:thioredoxin domain-containing protein 15 isoform X2 n=1 Tax=Periplaneta americana TaxID=6978 RepID=UPI0037E76593
MFSKEVVTFLILAIPWSLSSEVYIQDNIVQEAATIHTENSNGEATSEIDTRPDELQSVSVNKYIDELHKQFEEQQAKIAKDNLEATIDDAGSLGNIEVLTTARGEEQLSAVTSEQQDCGNATVNATDTTDDTTNSTSTLVSCTTGKETVGQPVELVNSTRLLNLLVTEPNVTNRRSVADCVALLFYARCCPFSSLAAPHFNALSRAFPDIKMAAVDAMKHHSFNTQYGIVGVPTVMLFHNGRPAAKFNDSEYNLEMFTRFITKYTGMEPQGKLVVTSADFGGPVPSVPVKETDYCLALSWIFILVCGVYFFSKSTWWRWIVETIQNTWREAEAQHEHVE